MRMALAGDTLITRSLSQYRAPEFLALAELLREADFAAVNLESVFHDFEGYPNAACGGTWVQSDPLLAEDLAWLGIDAVSRANNHCGDYSHESQVTTDAALEAAGIVHAGTGENLQQAREPRYVETGSGRVGLVSCAATFLLHAMAGHPHADVLGRPGVSPLRVNTVYELDRDSFARLRALAGDLGLGEVSMGSFEPFEIVARKGLRMQDLSDPSGTSLVFLGERFQVADRTGRRHEILPSDLDEVLAAVEDARGLSDYVVVSVHAHGAGEDPAVAPEYLQAFARAAIGAGADAVVGHGPHILRGVEIYEGKPIFYSLGNLIFEMETIARLPDDAYRFVGLGPHGRPAEVVRRRFQDDRIGFPSLPDVWRSVVAEPRFDSGRLVDLTLHPITLGFGRPAPDRGRPELADPQAAAEILHHVAELSVPYGTRIDTGRGIGTVRLG